MIKTFFTRWILALFCIVTGLSAQAAAIVKFTLTATPQGIALHLIADGPLSYHTFDLQKPPRLVLDIQNATWAASVPAETFLNTHIKNIRVGYRQKKSVLRLVLDLGRLNHETVRATVKQNRSYPNRIDINLSSKLRRPAHAKPQPVDILSKWLKQAAEPIHLTPLTAPKTHLSKQRTINKPQSSHLSPLTAPKKHTFQRRSTNSPTSFTLVIDPGHGGKDPGAIGSRGSKEKNITLSISKKVAQLLKKYPGTHIYLTRHSNRYLTLRQRLRYAQKLKADLFISIHADAFRRKSAHGASIYALSERGATSEAARWLARHENHSVTFTNSQQPTSKLLQYVLIDLSQAKSIQHSLIAGKSIINQLKRVTTLHKRQIEQAAFVVLKSPNIPSLLIETGFLSNRQEERKLNNRRYQNRLALAIANGIIRYGHLTQKRQQHPHTQLIDQRIKKQKKNRVKWKKSHNKQIHIVKSGESWWSIAKKYGLSIRQLKSLNPGVRRNLRIATRLRIRRS